jgi:hypothetical protein
VPFAAGALADDDAGDAVELADLIEVEQRAVDLYWCLADLLKEQDRAFEARLPGRTDGVDQVAEAAADEREVAHTGTEQTGRRSSERTA